MMDQLPIALVIGASKEAAHGIEVAQRLGFHVVAFDGDPEAEGLSLADEAHVVDIRDPKAIIERLEGRTPTCVIPVPIGRWLITTGFINDHYGLKGPSLPVCEICTDKYAFHEALYAKGLRDAQCELVPSGARSLGTSFAFPVVAKPRFGSGSRAVRVIASQGELDSYLQVGMPFDEDMVIESVWGGEEYGVDGVVCGGRLSIILLRKKELTPLPARQCVGYYGLSKDAYKSLYDAAERYLTAVNHVVGMTDCVFHADLMVNGAGTFAIEISPRPSGHNLHNLFTPMASGVDIIETFLKGVMGEAVQAGTVSGQYLIHYFDFEDCNVISVPDDAYLQAKYPLTAYSCNLKPGDFLERVFDGHTLMSRGYFVLHGDSEKELMRLKDNLMEEFEVRNA